MAKIRRTILIKPHHDDAMALLEKKIFFFLLPCAVFIHGNEGDHYI